MAIQSISSTLWQTCKRPWSYARALVAPQESPSDILRRIAASADRTIQDATLHGVRVPSQAGAIDKELNDLLHPAEPLPGRVHWESRQKELLKTLTDKISIFTALLQMRNRAGIQEANNLKVLGMVQQATESRAPVSLWDLFVSQYELSWFQKLSAAFFYWFYYQTSLIHNTTDAYLEAFFRHLTTDLTKQSDATRIKVFRALIEEVNEFLSEDIKASRAYAYGDEAGSLAKLQDQAIERVYGGLLNKLCEDFSLSQVLGASPQVRILKDFQDLLIIGHVFKAFEWAINRYVIQSAMMYSILPQALQTGVNQGIAITHVDNLPFVISLTQFFTSQLESLRLHLENQTANSSPSLSNDPIQGTELLPPTIKLLLQTLALEGPYTPLELRKRFELLEKAGNSLIDATVLQAMEKGVIESGNTLFSYLNTSIRSGELLTRLLELSLNPFSGQVKTEEMLRAEYREEQSKFFRTSDNVFRQLIRMAISPMQDADSKQKSETAHKTLELQKIVATRLIQKMGALCDQIKLKIESSRGEVGAEYDIQKDFVALSQLMQVLDSRHEFQDPLRSLDDINRNEVWGIFNSLFTKIEKLQEQMTKLRSQSQNHLEQTSVIHLLQATQAVVESLRREPTLPLTEILRTNVDKLIELFQAHGLSTLFLQTKFASISENARRVALENNALEALRALYSQPSSESAPQGLLVDLMQAEQGISVFGFRRGKILNQIARHLTHFSDEERANLARLIGDGSQLSRQLDQLRSSLQSIYTTHSVAKQASQEILENDLHTLQMWNHDQIREYSDKKDQAYQAMRTDMQALFDLKTHLLKAVEEVPSSLTTPLSRILLNGASVALPLSSAYYLGAPLAIGAGVSAMAYRLFNPAVPAGGSFKRSLFKKCSAIAAATLGAWCVPASALNAAACIPAAMSGKDIVDLSKEYVEHRVFDQVWDKFTQAYQFSCSQRVYKALLTRFLKRTVQADKS